MAESYLSTPTRQRFSSPTAKDTGWPLLALWDISDSMTRSSSFSGESWISYLPFIRNSIFISNSFHARFSFTRKRLTVTSLIGMNDYNERSAPESIRKNEDVWTLHKRRSTCVPEPLGGSSVYPLYIAVLQY